MYALQELIVQWRKLADVQTRIAQNGAAKEHRAKASVRAYTYRKCATELEIELAQFVP